MTSACPTTKAAVSEHSQTTAAAISSGLPIRPTGSSAITLARPSGVPPVKRPIIGVSMYPGQTALMRWLAVVGYSRVDRKPRIKVFEILTGKVLYTSEPIDGRPSIALEQSGRRLGVRHDTKEFM